MEKLALNRSRRAFTRVGFAMLLMVSATVALQFLLAWLFAQYLENEWIRYIIMVLPQYLIAMPLAAMLIRRMPSLPAVQRKLGAGRFVIIMIVCFAVMYAGNLVGTLLNLMLQAIAGKEMSQPLFSLITDSGIWANLMFVVILAPIAEELFFRKLLIPRLLPFGEKPAVIVSGLIFGLIHGNFTQFFYAFGLGIAFGFIFVKTGKLAYTIILHMFINLIGSVISLLLIDASIVTAGLFGLLVICLVIAGIVLFFVNIKRTKMSRGLFGQPNGKAAVYLNPGVLLFFAGCAGLFALNTLSMFAV